MTTVGKLPHAPKAKKVIEYAFEEARNLNTTTSAPNIFCLAYYVNKRELPPECWPITGSRWKVLGKKSSKSFQLASPPESDQPKKLLTA